MLSGRGLCDELITRPEESYRLCCVAVCDLETSRIGAPYIYDISRLRVNLPTTLQLATTKQARTLSPLKDTELEFMKSARYLLFYIFTLSTVMLRKPER